MPYTLTWEPRGVVAAFTGRIATPDLMKVYELISADPRFDDLRFMVADFEAVTDFDVPLSDVDQMAMLDYAASLSNSRLVGAHVATDPRKIALLERYVAVNDSAHEHRIFPTQRAAREWIASRLPK